MLFLTILAIVACFNGLSAGTFFGALMIDILLHVLAKVFSEQ